MLTEDLNIENQQQVWDRFREGDDTAYSLIYKEYAHVMFSFGMRFTTDRELVKDCIQDIFVKLYSKRQQLNSTGSIKFYLLVAMKNELFNIFRKNITFYSIHTMEYDLASDIQLEDKLISDEESIERNNMISQILEILTPRQREVIYYRYIEELSFAEIEQLMQINVQSIQNLIHRSIKKVREKFPDYVLYTLFPIIFQ